MEKNIHPFFAAYEKRFNDAINGALDVQGMADAFGPYFVEASPVGIQGGANDQNFHKKIPKGMEFYKKIGTHKMEITDEAVTTLDDYHYMVKIHWKAYYKNKDNTDLVIEFDVIYFLQDLNNELKIFAYITGNEQEVLRKNGLIQ
jgi:hypothetical protein